MDSKGRVIIPRAVRERLGLEAGAEVEIHEEDGRAIVELEADPERIIDRMEVLIEEAAAKGNAVPYEDLDVCGRDHADTIRRQAREAERGDE